VKNFNVIPYVPMGATLSSFARLVYQVNAHGSFDKTCERLFGSRINGRALLFGAHAEYCAQVVGKGTFASARRILENHTVWPFFAYMLPEPMREAWCKAQESFERYPSRRFLSQRNIARLLKARYHGCPACIQSDLDNYGVAFWRVQHQLCSIDHCPKHRVALISDCQRCGTFSPSFINSTLPSLKCKTCGSQLTAMQTNEQPEAYWKVLDLIQYVFEGHWHILSPEFRSTYFTARLQSLGKFPPSPEFAMEITGEIQNELESVHTNNLLEQLSPRFSTESVFDALSGTSMITNPVLSLLLMERLCGTEIKNCIIDLAETVFTEAETPDQFLRHGPRSWDTGSCAPFALPQCKDLELRCTLFKLGLAPDLVDDLATGRRSWASLLNSRYHGTTKARALFHMLPWFHSYTEAVRQKAVSRQKAISRNKPTSNDLHHELTRERHRATCLAYISSTHLPTRSKFAKKHPGAYLWLRAQDTCWFISQIPRVRERKCRLSTPKTRKDSREGIRTLLAEHPGATRTELWHLEKNALIWASAYDYDWLQVTLPPRCSRRTRSA
jgi:hypothetical protein